MLPIEGTETLASSPFCGQLSGAQIAPFHQLDPILLLFEKQGVFLNSEREPLTFRSNNRRFGPAVDCQKKITVAACVGSGNGIHGITVRDERWSPLPPAKPGICAFVAEQNSKSYRPCLNDVGNGWSLVNPR
jgi:hypothetical protein